MMVFHDQKTSSLNFVIASVSLRHYGLTKIFIEYLFLEQFFVSFDLFWRWKQPPDVFCKKGVRKNFAKFTGRRLRYTLF